MRSIDIKNRLNTSKNYLIHNPDRSLENLPFFDSNLAGDEPPYYEHSMWDLCDVGWRFVEAWHMIRRVTGEQMGEDERRLRSTVFSSIRDDGLSYRTEEQWCTPEAWMWDQGRALLALCTLAEHDDSREEALSVAGKMLRALERIALVDGDALWFPAEGWTGSAWGSPPVGHPTTGLQIEGAVRYYRLTNEEWARGFAERVARGVVSRTPPILSPEGRFVRNGGGPDVPQTHIHSRLFILYGLHLLGKATGDDGYVKMAEQGHYAALEKSTSYGWVPERIEQLDNGIYGYDEVCCIMDVIKYALERASEPEPEWYDLIERFTANAVVAHQIDGYTKIEPFISRATPPQNTHKRNYDKVLERSIGGFTGALHAHEYWRTAYGEDGIASYPIIGASGCCSPSGIICLALAWQHSLEESDRSSTIHMHFARNGRNVDIERADLDAGNLNIRIKKPISSLKVRIHPWANYRQINVRDKNGDLSFDLDGSYISIPNPAGAITVSYPSSKRAVVEPWRGGKLVSVWSGNLVDELISDIPQRLPLFPVC